MRRLFLEIWVSVVVTAVVVAIGVGAFGRWYFEGREARERERVELAGETFVASLDGVTDRVEVAERLAAWAADAEVAALLWGPDGEVRATVGRAGRRRDARDGRDARAAARVPHDEHRPWFGPSAADRRRHRRPPPWAWTSVPTPDGGTLELASTKVDRSHRLAPWTFVATFLVIIALGAWPVSRRVTRSLENLRRGAAKLGEGDLSTRVPVEGRNEVADVARAFNDAAAKIEQAAQAQRRMLASASHELRSPLGRLRAAVELIAEGQTHRLAEAERDVEELDVLIEDLLLAGRIGAAPDRRTFAPVDLAGIAREEAERAGAECTGTLPALEGDARMLRRLIGNLLENARRHGAPPIRVALELDEAAACVRITVSDAGGGVGPLERERIFEAFYRPTGHAESRDGGVGLGLALVAEIAAHHGGIARCVADERFGSVFVVELPLQSG